MAESHGVVTDELQHAADALAVLSVLGGDAPPLEEPVLALPWAHLPAREASLRAGLEVLALNESLAVPLFAAMRARATEGTVLGALDRIGADEPRHAALGWTFLHWAVSAWPDARSVLQQSLPGALDRLQRSYGSLPHDAWPDDDVRWAWGLLDGATYASVLQRHLRGTLTHRLTELGLTVASR